MIDDSFLNDSEVNFKSLYKESDTGCNRLPGFINATSKAGVGEISVDQE